jgi:hypothetical protein
MVQKKKIIIVKGNFLDLHLDAKSFIEGLDIILKKIDTLVIYGYEDMGFKQVGYF